MRLIDADDLKKTWYKEHKIEPGERGAMFVGNNEVPKYIDRARTIDAVPVVRCKDCKYWDKDTLRHNSNDAAEWDECECEMLANRDRWNEIDRYCCGLHFCADGERRDDETD